MRLALRLSIAALVALLAFAAAPAHAQESDYVGERPPAVGDDQFDRPVSQPGGDAPAVAPAAFDRPTEVRGVQVARGLAVTGGDVIGLSVIGLSLIAVGAFLVRRRRHALG